MIAADLLARFPDLYDKRPVSNLGKLMAIVAEQLTKIEQTLATMAAWRDIDQASGAALDRIGVNVGQERGAASDEVYRKLIKSKIARNMSLADINTIIRVVATAIGAPYSEVKIKPRFADAVAPEPAAIALEDLPIGYANQIGFSVTQLARIVEKTAAAGVRVVNVQLLGTFELGDIPLTTSATAGLGDAEDPDIGGYLGAAYGPSNDIDLPI